MPITAILVTYNSQSVIAAALTSLIASPQIHEIILVDNASADNTRNIVAQNFPHVRIIANALNEGFGRANNRALEQVTTPYALLLNPDAVLQAGALQALLDAAKAYPDAAILSPQLADDNAKEYRSHKRSIFQRECSRDQAIAPLGDCCAEFLSGAVWLLNMAHIKKIGFFDPNIFLYYEDDDLCLRARAAGFGLVLVHAAHAMHLMGASSGKLNYSGEFFRQKQMFWSRIYIEQKYQGRSLANKLALKLLIICTFKMLWYGLVCNHARFHRYRGRLAGIIAFISGKPAHSPAATAPS